MPLDRGHQECLKVITDAITPKNNHHHQPSAGWGGPSFYSASSDHYGRGGGVGSGSGSDNIAQQNSASTSRVGAAAWTGGFYSVKRNTKISFRIRTDVGSSRMVAEKEEVDDKELPSPSLCGDTESSPALSECVKKC